MATPRSNSPTTPKQTKGPDLTQRVQMAYLGSLEGWHFYGPPGSSLTSFTGNHLLNHLIIPGYTLPTGWLRTTPRKRGNDFRTEEGRRGWPSGSEVHWFIDREERAWAVRNPRVSAAPWMQLIDDNGGMLTYAQVDTAARMHQSTLFMPPHVRAERGWMDLATPPVKDPAAELDGEHKHWPPPNSNASWYFHKEHGILAKCNAP